MSLSITNISGQEVTSGALEAAVTGAINAGITFTLSAGNSGIGACNVSPARVAPGLTVGASTTSDTRGGYNFGSCLDLFAPGFSIPVAGIASDVDDTFNSGTSFSAPHVAARRRFIYRVTQLLRPCRSQTPS